MLPNLLRKCTARVLTGHSGIALENRVPSPPRLAERFEGIDELGVYLHIPFCRQICPYCPYNKERFDPEAARRYADAVVREIDHYAAIVGGRPVTSLYIGGGTPTTMLDHGLPRVLAHLRDTLNVQCDVHMESHLNDLDDAHLDAIEALGVQHLSMGVEALTDRSLRILKRPYTVDQARAAIRRTVARSFRCVNVDLMFALPGQTSDEVERAARELVELGVHQVATYPLFRFPYTRMGSNGKLNNYGLGIVFKRWSMLKALQRVFYAADYRRSSVWAFTKRGVPRYCSVTVPLYLGLGASGGTYLKDIFYVNTFNVAEYVGALEQGRLPIALSVDLTERMQKAGWLYWRVYETQWEKAAFARRFDRSFDHDYGWLFKTLRLLRLAVDDGRRITLTDRGAYWLHALEDVLSIDYISQLWGTAKETPWPERVSL